MISDSAFLRRDAFPPTRNRFGGLPYVGLAPRGPEDLFTAGALRRVFQTLERLGPTDGAEL